LKRIVIAFPPDRFSRELANNAHGYFVIGHKKFAQSQLPETVTKRNGFVLRRPESWK
jgi:hypothetical protein